jgi:hemin uptake protein HemP
MNEQPQIEHASSNSTTTDAKQPMPRIASSALFKGVQEIIIDHMGQEYRLRLTGQGKLLLTK